MRIWRAMKVFYEIVTDREVYFLLGLAFRDLFRKTKSDPKPAMPLKKRAKAMSAGAVLKDCFVAKRAPSPPGSPVKTNNPAH